MENKLTQKQIALENQTEIRSLTDKVTLLEKNSKETGEDVKRILFYFDSDAKTKTEGFIEKVNRHDTELKGFSTLISNGKFGMWIIGVISSIIGGAITWLINVKQ